MARLLVNNPHGEQELIEVGFGGGYFDETRVLWDERADGPLNVAAIMAGIGGWTRQGQSLVQDVAKKSAADAALALVQAAQADQEAKKSTRKNLLKAVHSVNTPAEVRAVLVALVEHLGLDQ